MNKPPLVRAVKAQPPQTLTITWSTGETPPVDVSRLVRRFKLYGPLRDPVHFRKAKVDAWGHAVQWPGDVDMGADQLYEMAREQAGEWGPERFAAWMAEHDLSLNTAADALGLSRRTMAHYRTGSRPFRTSSLWLARPCRHAGPRKRCKRSGSRWSDVR